MKMFKNKLFTFFALVLSVLLSACGIKNPDIFVGEDARFANYSQIGTNSDGLIFYEDSANPGSVAVAVGTCSDQIITVASTYNGKSVTEVMPGGFSNCKTIRSINLPASITGFGTDAFAGSSLEFITIPNLVEVISTGCFRNCQNLNTVNFERGNSVTRINSYAFANDHRLADVSFNSITNLEYIGEEAFLYCLGLRSVILPKGFLTLSAYAFHDCQGLTTIYFPASITTISEYAFRGVGVNATIYFNETQEQAFGDCGIPYTPGSKEYKDLINYRYNGAYIPIVFGVGDLMIVGNFKYIHPDTGVYKLMKCSSNKDDLSKWTVSATDVQYTETIADDEVLLLEYEDDGRTAIDIPATINWGSDYKVVGIYPTVFKENLSIRSVVFHENLRFIDYQAFSGCQNLTSINFDDAVDLKHIQSRAFFDCLPYVNSSSRYKIKIPVNVESIETDAFRNCDALFNLYIDGASDTYVDTFINTSAIYANTNYAATLTYEPSEIIDVFFGNNGSENTTATIAGNKVVNIRNSSTNRTGTNNVIRVKYKTNSTTTQKFVANGTSATFNLSAKAEAIGSVKVGDSVVNTFDYSNVGEKTSITLSQAPQAGSVVTISYRAKSKLARIEAHAFRSCFDRTDLQNYNRANPPIYFPESLELIGSGAFASSNFVGGAIFQSNTLVIKDTAFYSIESFGVLEFKDSMSSLSLASQAFAQSSNMYSAYPWNHKLFSVILPQNTTITGNNVFENNQLLTIYCIGSLPSGISSYSKWNYVSSKRVNANLGDMSSADISEHDYIPVHLINSVNDFTQIPNAENPIFDFVKIKGQTTATLTRYRQMGALIRDHNGYTAQSPVNPTNVTADPNTTTYRNSSFNSQYLKFDSRHWRAIIPSSVSFDNGNTYTTVTGIGDYAFMFGSNKSAEKSSSRDYWLATANYWTIRWVVLPDSIQTIGKFGFGGTPLISLVSYNNANSVKSWHDCYISDGTVSDEGYFPSSLKVLDKGAFGFTGITKAYLPAGMTGFGGLTSSSNPTSSNYHFAMLPFHGCFDLDTIEFVNVQPGQTYLFNTYGNTINFHNQSTGKDFFIEGASASTSISIPWGATDMAQGTLRGARKVTSITFPYTMTQISDYFIDSIGSSYDKDGGKGTNNIATVKFESGVQYGVSQSEINACLTPKCRKIGFAAFWGCTKLKNFEIPYSLEEIGTSSNGNVFTNCAALNNFTVDSGANGGTTSVAMGSVLDCTKTSLRVIGNGAFTSCNGITELITSTNMTGVSGNAFSTCTGLTRVTLASTTKSIGSTCFKGCTYLNTLNSNVTSGLDLGSEAFSGDTRLANVSLVDSSTKFGNSSFSGCTSLRSFTIPGNSTVGNLVFNACTGLTTTTSGTGSNRIVSSGGVVVGKTTKFSGTVANSAFKGCNQNTCIFLKDTDTQYIASRPGGGSTLRYPDGWNFYNTTQGLKVYCQAPSDSDRTDSKIGHWRLNASGQIQILNDPS
ncbi:MAG: leucine-rich repeat domain-containing protein [Bacilli bacterium]|nr:leucine-rich repeat domain-containing protein [Bacilli bacterium]